jgi:hypothetical protein
MTNTTNTVVYLQNSKREAFFATDADVATVRETLTGLGFDELADGEVPGCDGEACFYFSDMDEVERYVGDRDVEDSDHFTFMSANDLTVEVTLDWSL